VAGGDILLAARRWALIDDYSLVNRAGGGGRWWMGV
jgi:hypothetical protein